MTNEPPTWRITFLSLIFCTNMLLMDLVMEAMTRNVTTMDGSAVGLSITLAQFGGCFLVAWFGGGRLFTDHKGATTIEWRGFVPYALLSFLIFCGTGLANLALAYVQYPVKIVFKSSKLVPVMIVSVIMRNSKAFSWKEYTGALLICMGTAGFSWNPAKDTQTTEMAYLGVLMLCVAAIGDALSSNLQQKMMQREEINPTTLMVRLNFFGLIGLIFIQTFSGSASQLYMAAGAEPMVLAYMIGIGVTIGFGVWANTNLINEAGSVVAMTVATLRKVVTMLLSYIVFPKPFTSIHSVAAVLVLMGILLSDFFKTKKKDAEPCSRMTRKNREVKDADQQHMRTAGDAAAPPEGEQP